MERIVKFRAKRLDNGAWVYGSLVCDEEWAKYYIYQKEKVGAYYQLVKHLIDEKTVGQSAGLIDKNGRNIYEGDIVRRWLIETEYQTHTGNNIPNGSYTEPCGCNVRVVTKPVVFAHCGFTTSPYNQSIDMDDYDDYEQCLLFMPVLNKLHISDIIYPRPYGRTEPMPDDEILEIAQDMFNDAGINIEALEQAIGYINGIEIIGNIYENPELLNS